ncbi:MAG TPA: hypothetical protein VG370_17320 [Chloroflexota bacterium]|nr:hypothetical protein [Chloroflexota bacterium]
MGGANGAQIQGAILDQALVSGGLIWVVVAIFVGLWASEIKKRRFWLWVLLSLLTGPVAWYLLFVRLGVAVPASVAVACPTCGRLTRKDMPRCIHCKSLLEKEKKDRAADVGRQAATVLFTAKRVLNATRRAADAASRGDGRSTARRARRPPPSPKERGAAPRDDSPGG